MKTMLLAILLALSGCCAQTEQDPAPAPSCAWADNTYACDPALFSRSVTEIVDGAVTCEIYTYHCGDVVDACKREVYSCQPNVVLGGPNPGAERAE